MNYRTPESFELTGVSINSTPIKVLYKTGNPFIIKHFTVGATEFMTFDEMQGSHVYMDCNQDQDFTEEYRFGFNGIEKVNEVAGVGNHYTAQFGEYDTRVVPAGTLTRNLIRL